MSTKKFFSLLSILVLISLVLSACAAPTAAPTTAPAAPAANEPAAPAAPAAMTADKITIAGVVFQDDQFMNTLTKGYTDAGCQVRGQSPHRQHQ